MTHEIERHYIFDTRPDIPEDPAAFYWRAEASANEEHAHVYLTRYRVIRETECTVILDVCAKEQRVFKGALKSFAYATKKEAVRSWLARLEWSKYYTLRAMTRVESLEKLVEECKLREYIK